MFISHIVIFIGNKTWYIVSNKYAETNNRWSYKNNYVSFYTVGNIIVFQQKFCNNNFFVQLAFHQSNTVAASPILWELRFGTHSILFGTWSLAILFGILVTFLKINQEIVSRLTDPNTGPFGILFGNLLKSTETWHRILQKVPNYQNSGILIIIYLQFFKIAQIFQ